MKPTRTIGVIAIAAVACGLLVAIPSGAVTATHRARATHAGTCPLSTRLAGWTLARLAAQTIVVPVDSGAVSSVDGEVAEGVGGIILLGDDASPSLERELARLDAHALDAISPAVMVDEEGGAVQRLASVVGTLPSARTMAATMSAAAIEALGKREGSRLRALGVTVDLAPVVDLDGAAGPNNRDADGTRSFSANPTIASNAALAFAAGLTAGGIVPVFKHFPGLGGATANTDLAPASTVSYRSLQAAGLLPFRRAIAQGAKAVMVSNASVPGLSSLPSSVSPTVISTLLRRDLGFGGLVLTDSLSVPSVTPKGGSIAQTVTAALEAGADMVLFNSLAGATASTTRRLIVAIVTAVGNRSLPRARLVAAAGHVLVAKHELPPCPA